MSLIENLVREELNPVDEAEAFSKIGATRRIRTGDLLITKSKKSSPNPTQSEESEENKGDT